MERIRRGFLKYFVLISFVTYYSGATMFYHSHISGEEKIVHSHLYLAGDASTPSHTHSSASLSLISLLISSLNFIAAALILQSAFSKLLSVILINEERLLSLVFHLQSQSRAPPSVS